MNLDLLTQQLEIGRGKLSDREMLMLADKLIESIRLLRDKIFAALKKEWEGRDFLRRFYAQDVVFGEDDLFLEPQAFALQVQGMDDDRKRRMLTAVCERVLVSEKTGARQNENPPDHNDLEPGSQDNGGIWYALNGPLIIGAASIDLDVAWDLLNRISFANQSRNFPNYWSGYWSAPDTMESSLIISEGLPDQNHTYWKVPVFCAHPHAWPLYCYYYLKEQENG